MGEKGLDKNGPSGAGGEIRRQVICKEELEDKRIWDNEDWAKE